MAEYLECDANLFFIQIVNGILSVPVCRFMLYCIQEQEGERKMKRWQLKRTKVNIEAIAADLGIQPATAAVLANRKLLSPKQTRDFLYPTAAQLYDGLQMQDMERGLALVEAAVCEGKKIAVYGDYDVDGVMSTTILTRTIQICGGEVIYYVPHRQQEGYGLNPAAVEQLAVQGVGLLFTCDNGIAALREVEIAKEKGMDVVILDHHEPQFTEGREGKMRDILPKGDAVIDPKRRDCHYPFPLLCAAGISYKFALLLLRRFGKKEERLEKELLCFAAVATVCDIVDLLEENRTLVQLGLQEIQHTTNVGLQMLLEETGLGQRQVTEYHLGFVIGPCINATGRLESGRMAVELFCETDAERARQMARHLIALNEERKTLTAKAVERLTQHIEVQETPLDPVLVLYDESIHESIAGIVAGRIKDRYYHPTILITDAEDGAKGSARSIEGYHIFEELFACRDLFTRFGGHAMAAGLSLPKENILLLRQRLNTACQLTEAEMTPVLRIEKILHFFEIHMTLAEELKTLAPFGKENPAPLFATRNVWVEQLRLIGKQKDMLQMTLREEGSPLRLAAVSFDGLTHLRDIVKELYPQEDCDTIIQSGRLPMQLDFVYSIAINAYNGRTTVQLMIRDFRVAR